MWTRVELKNRAKSFLKQYYIQAFLAGLVLAIATYTNSGSSRYSADHRGEISGIVQEPVFWGVGITVLLFVLAIKVFLLYPLNVGAVGYYVKGAEERKSDLSMIKTPFQNGRFMNICMTMLYRGVLTFLWFLLLIVPGIIMSYAYRFVPYILNDNPDLTPSEAIDLSKRLTEGQKMDIFILDISFFGWFLLGSLAFGVGTLFVNPYYYATNGELYVSIRDAAIRENRVSASLLNKHAVPNHAQVEDDFWYND